MRKLSDWQCVVILEFSLILAIFMFFLKAIIPKHNPMGKLITNDDVIPASPLISSTGKKSIARNAKRRNALGNTTSSECHAFTPLQKSGTADRSVRTVYGIFNHGIKKEKIIKETTSSISYEKKKLADKSYCRKEIYETTLCTNIEGEKQECSAVELNQSSFDRQVGRSSKCNQPHDKSCSSEFNQQMDAIHVKDSHIKVSTHGQGTKRVFNSGRSGLSPMKKKHAFCIGDTWKDTVCKKELGFIFIDGAEGNENWSNSEGSKLTALKDSSSHKDRVSKQTDPCSPFVKQKPIHGDREYRNVSEVSKLPSSFRFSKKSFKKLNSLSRQSSFSNRARKPVGNERDFSNEDIKNDTLCDNNKIETSFKNSQTNSCESTAGFHSIPGCHRSVGKDHVHMASGHLLDVKSDASVAKNYPELAMVSPEKLACNTELLNEEKSVQHVANFEAKSTLDSNVADSNHICASQQDNLHIRAIDDRESNDTVFNASKDSFTDILSEIDLSSVEQTPDMCCHDNTLELRNGHTDSKPSL